MAPVASGRCKTRGRDPGLRLERGGAGGHRRWRVGGGRRRSGRRRTISGIKALEGPITAAAVASSMVTNALTQRALEAEMDELRDLLALLKLRGLHGHISEGPPEQIIGGRSVSMTMGIPIYGGSFSTSHGRHGWLVRTDGEGQLVNEVTVATADEVIRAIVDAL
jgi:hypothetical protein